MESRRNGPQLSSRHDDDDESFFNSITLFNRCIALTRLVGQVRALDSRRRGCEFDSRPTKLFTHVPLVTKQYNSVPAKGR